MNAAPPEARESLWLPVSGPLIWAAHFLLCYVTGAIWCAKFAAPHGELDTARLLVGTYTLLALALIALAAHHGWRRHRHRTAAPPPHGGAATAKRHRFLGFVAVLLCALSAIAVLYTAAVAALIRNCA